MIDRVLVVDDHEPWRRYVCSVLQKTSRWQVVGQAADGFDAVEQARVLTPDLILLDIGLPTLNGIQVARQVLKLHPCSKILFVTEHQALEIAEAALEAGGRGYIIKSDAAADLLPAMEAVMDGGRFLSAKLAIPLPKPTDHGAVQQ